MACGCHHFEATQRLKAPECWCHLNPAVWSEVCRARTKACKQVLARNSFRTKCNNLVKIMPWMTHNHISLTRRTITRWRWFWLFKKNGIIEERARRTGNTDWCLCEFCIFLAQVTSEYFTFLLPAFKPGIQCSHNRGPPVIWIISLCLYIRYISWSLLWNF